MSQEKSFCDEKRAEDISWLNDLLKGKEKAAVFVFEHEGRTLIEFHHCYQCPDAMVFYYDCSGEKVCETGGFMGANTCPEFDLSQKKQVYPKKE